MIYNDSASALESAIQGCWRWGASTLEKARQEGRIEFIKDKKARWIAYEKIFAPLEGEEKTKKYTTWIDEVNTGTSELKDLFEKGIFDYPKSPTLIYKFLKMGNVEEEDIVLDFFSGSATTAHAVMQLNAEDGGNRRFIMVQLPEETAEDSEARKAGYKNICEIGKERIRRAGKKIREEVVSKELLVVSKDKDLFDEGPTTNNQQLTTQKLNTGFRVFRIDESNFTNVNRAPGEYSQDQLDLFLDNVKPDRTDLDLLFGAMLSWGVELSLPLEVQEVVSDELLVVSETAPNKLTTTQLKTNNYTTKIYIVNDGDLVACFSENVSEAVIKAMADKQPLRVLFRDSCFTQDDQKINLFEQFKQHLDWSEEEALSRIRVI